MTIADEKQFFAKEIFKRNYSELANSQKELLDLVLSEKGEKTINKNILLRSRQCGKNEAFLAYIELKLAVNCMLH